MRLYLRFFGNRKGSGKRYKNDILIFKAVEAVLADCWSDTRKTLLILQLLEG